MLSEDALTDIRYRVKKKIWMNEVVVSKKAGKMSDGLATLLTDLTKRYAHGPNFKGFTYNEDMQAYAMVMLCRTWDKFKPELSDNPFAFYTQCIKGSFCQFLNREKRERDIKKALEIENAGKTNSYSMVDEEQYF